MNNKIDLRVLKTEQAIKQNFKDMLMEMPFEKISIKELCDRAMIGRRTFYMHYLSLEDVLEEFQEEQTTEYFERIKDFDHIKDVDKLIKVFFEFAEEKGEFYEKIHCNSNYDYIHKKQTNKISIKSQDNFQSIRKFDEPKQNIILTYITSSISGIYTEWVNSGKIIPLEEIIDLATTLIKSGIDKIL